ncbi:hypothetical protein A3D03_03760 [Candidatus Gottesmanbacteria bacterium RIFCSPHIGHO2_02_FULL_40_13]|uniref:Uncharacterized protein n=1 Tax=Candidatus Gottesmanbacteria bacterium RIFCSPHIGHO2_02_FULL_40_13 TaxID=1798384 RepID=A0A1F6ACM1_9BACT|nr:MAG: hypothetical protein A3D03_03760 [Candidatus Gottesmanbacteria bacterium RIFCSPHIGHO2_02_FULL_40_13]
MQSTANINSSPISSAQPIPPSPLQAPSSEKIPASLNIKKIILFAGIISLILLILAFTLTYFFYVKPRMATVKIINTLSPQITSLKTSARSVIAVVDQIHLLVTAENPEDFPLPLETSGLIIHPQLSYLQMDQEVLGLQSPQENFLVEQNAQNIQEEMSNFWEALGRNQSQIAGIRTVAENISTQKTRELKDETIKAKEYVAKAQKDLDELVSSTTQTSSSLNKTNRDKLMESQKVKKEISPYFSEAGKVAGYYQILSDTLISINTKISSFKNSLSAVSSALSNITPDEILQNGLKTRASQAQIFLDQAQKDTADIKSLADTLQTISAEELPANAGEYHAHNLAVLSSVHEYFVTTSGILQGFITAFQVISGKAEKNQLSTVDMNMIRSVIMAGINQAKVADAKFASDLLKLVGEEQSLTLTFWQNNTVINQGVSVEASIDAYEKSLDKLKQNSKVPLFVK